VSEAGFVGLGRYSRTVVLLPPSPGKDASRQSRRVVRSFCCDRHRRIGFDGTLSAFDSRLALRALLGRHRSTRAFAQGPASQRSPSVRCVTDRCRGVRPDGLLVALSVRAAPANEPSPLRRSPHRDQLLPDVPSSDYRRRAQGFSPSSRLHGPVCVSGLVSSRTRPWGSTLQGLHPSQSRDASRHPLPS